MTRPNSSEISSILEFHFAVAVDAIMAGMYVTLI